MTDGTTPGTGEDRDPQTAAGPGTPAEPPTEPIEPTEATEVTEATSSDGSADDDTFVGDENLADDSEVDLVADLATSQQAVAALTDDLKRLQAEYVNYKRRVDRDRQLVKENATFSVLSALLPVLDDLDRAREHGELEGGFKAVADSLERIVAAQGLVKFGKPGDEFDPRFHEALMHSHSAEVTTTTCRDVISAGYQIGERVVRPARVTVVDPEPGDAPSVDHTV